MNTDCVLKDRICTGCDECEVCDILPNKRCNNCGQCIEELDEFRTIKIDDFMKSTAKKDE